MSNLTNHPSYWLADDAAASLNRYEQTHPKINMTDGGRTVAQQQALINRWYQGGAQNRPPYLYKPYEPAASGPHVGGHALDTEDYTRFAQTAGDYGWVHNLPSSDPVHFIYDASRDKHKGGTSTSGGATGSEVVRQRQDWLNRSSAAKLVVDGVAGPATVAAIKKYQSFLAAHYGYKGAIDGVWGPGTQVAHQKYFDASMKPKPATPAAGGALKKGSSGAAVKALQTRLNRDYPAYSKLAVDGIFGAGTDSVVKEFQRRSGLTVDGIVGAATKAKLGL